MIQQLEIDRIEDLLPNDDSVVGGDDAIHQDERQAS